MLNKDFHNSFSSHLCTLAQFFNPSSRNFFKYSPLFHSVGSRIQQIGHKIWLLFSRILLRLFPDVEKWQSENLKYVFQLSADFCCGISLPASITGMHNESTHWEWISISKCAMLLSQSVLQWKTYQHFFKWLSYNFCDSFFKDPTDVFLSSYSKIKMYLHMKYLSYTCSMLCVISHKKLICIMTISGKIVNSIK